MQIRMQRPETTQPAPSIVTNAGESTVEPRPAPAAAEPRSARSPDSAPPSALVKTTATPPPASTSISAQPLPAADTPLADILDELSRRADAGEPGAACRLAAELMRCSHRDELVFRLNSASMLQDRSRPSAEPSRDERQRANLSTAIACAPASHPNASPRRRTG
jgi:hypothetical protein